MIALDPQAMYEFTLAPYEGEANPPVFVCKHMSARERLQFRGLLDQVGDNSAAGIAKTIEAITIALRGWRNVRMLDGVGKVIAEVGFDVQRLPDILTEDELADLLMRILRYGQLDLDARKNFASPSRSLPTADSNGVLTESAPVMRAT